MTTANRSQPTFQPTECPITAAFQEAVGQNIIAGRLPSGLAVSGFVDRWGMFPSFTVTVTDCQVPVIFGAVVVATLTRAEHLNGTGVAIKRRLEILAQDSLDGERMLVAVHFRKSLLAMQAKWLSAQPAGQVMAQWTPAVDDGSASVAAGGRYASLADLIRPRLAGGIEISSKQLFEDAAEVFGGTQAQGAYAAKDAYEAMEAALQRHILDMGGQWSPTGTATAALNIVSHIEVAANLLPTQSRRDCEMQEAEQFSTPPGLAFIAAWAANIGQDDVVFEPSAGNAALAVHARNAGAKAIYTNEISPRRCEILRYLGFMPTSENAEQIHNIFAGRISPTRILMNPPFTKSVATGGRQDKMIAGEHVIAALKLLADGGRLVAITSKRVSAWLDKTSQIATLRANILLDGRFFASHGTHIETRILVFDRATGGSGTPIQGQARSFQDLVGLLADLRPDAGAAKDQEVTDSRFVAYHPAKLFDADAQPHPDQLVESHAMAAVMPPAVTYRHHLPRELIKSGALSLAQLEAVTYAGQAHEQFVVGTGGRRFRKGYFIGDGTGVGKGREIAGIIRDNWEEGRHLAIWCTKDDTKLLAAAARDLQAVGIDPKMAFPLRKYALGVEIVRSTGIAVVGHGTLRSAKPGKPSRIDQIVAMVGEDFDGVLAIDESHKLGNALERKGARGKQQASLVALAGIELQARLPLARVVYISATGASEAMNLAYADRMGLWGDNMPFATAADFVDQIEMGGVAAMEVVARDMKAMGLYCARSLSFAGIRYERLLHELSPDQVALYDKLASAWQLVLSNIDMAMEEAGSSSDGRARSAALSAFWGAQQRFFSQVLISLQMPSVLTSIEADMAAGHAAVLQLVNTMEAAQNRALEEEGALENLEDLDLTPREVLTQFLETSFPARVYEEYLDAEGNTKTRPAFDSAGKPVISAEAIRMRDDLIAELGSLSVPQGPLEMLLDHFGVEAVAEITGRSRRVIYKVDEKTGQLVRQVERRNESARMADMQLFAEDAKRILVFSDAGGTGVDFHASRSFKNQRLRRHYLIQAGWNPKNALQGLGRSNRTFQAQPPEYILVTTNIRGQMRFITSIARRLGQLGALTKGQRDTGSVGLFSERDNLESAYAQEAVRQLIYALYRGDELVAGMNMDDFQVKMGLNLVGPEGQLYISKIPPVRQFLNRLLSLSVVDQNGIFEDFAERMEENIQTAIADGRYNVGVELYRANRVEEVKAPVIVYTHPESGAQTTYVHLLAWHKWEALRFDRAQAGLIGDGDRRKIVGWVKSKKSGDVFAVAMARSVTDEKGNVVARRRLVGPFEQIFVDADDVGTSWGAFPIITEDAAAALWEVQGQDKWVDRDLHLLTGVLLPIWDRIKGAGMVYRISTEEGRNYLGRIVSAAWVRSTLRALGATTDAWTPAEAEASILSGQPLTLANGWKLIRARVSGEYRIEVSGPGYSHFSRLREMGLILESINYKQRAFIPVGNIDVMSSLLATHPIVEDDDEIHDIAA